MAELISLTARAVKIGLKRGYDMGDFCKRYNTDETSFAWHLGTRIYPHGDQLEKVLRQIDDNTKKKRKRRAIKDAGIERQQDIARLANGTAAMRMQAVPASAIPQLRQDYDDLVADLTTRLNDAYDAKLAEIADFEAEYSELAKTRCNESEALEQMDAEIAELKGALQDKNRERMRAMASIDRLDKSISAVVKRRDKLSAEADDIQRQLSDLDKMEAYCAFADGSVASLEDLNAPVDPDKAERLRRAVEALTM